MYMYVTILLYSLVQATPCFSVIHVHVKNWEYPPIFLYVHWYGDNMYMHMYVCVTLHVCLCVNMWDCFQCHSVMLS